MSRGPVSSVRSGSGDRGQATVELALLLPLVVIGAAFLLHLGLSVSAQSQIEVAAREGARAAAVAPDRAGSEANVAVEKVADGRGFEVVTTVSSRDVTVTVTTSVRALPGFGGLGSRELSATVTMRREDLP